MTIIDNQDVELKLLTALARRVGNATPFEIMPQEFQILFLKKQGGAWLSQVSTNPNKYTFTKLAMKHLGRV